MTRLFLTGLNTCTRNTRNWSSGLSVLTTALFALLFCGSTHSAPYIPNNDNQIVERLPLASDPAARRVESLRRQLAARPDDMALRLDIARRYFALAMAQGDPRLVGYASAALAPLAHNPAAQNNGDYWLALGLIQQYSHDFNNALLNLGKAAQLQKQPADALAWRAAIFMVQARYKEAQADCTQLAALAEPLLGLGCSSYVQATTGQLAQSFQRLAEAVDRSPQAAPELRLWLYTRLGDMALRLGQPAAAENYFKKGLGLGITDQYLLGAYADFLLLQKRPAEVMTLLADWERSDVLLLRLALAAHAAKAPQAKDWAKQLRERFAAAALRGDRLHEQEAARFALDIEGDPQQALALASRNYQVQKEARDAEILLRSALAAQQAAAAQAALAWLGSSHYQDPALEQLARQLRAVQP